MILLPISSIIKAQITGDNDDERSYKLPPLRPYKCITCHKAFLRHDHLKRHIRTHTKESVGSIRGKKHLRSRSASSLKGPRTNQNPTSFNESFDHRTSTYHPYTSYIKPLEPQYSTSTSPPFVYLTCKDFKSTSCTPASMRNGNFYSTYSAYSAPSTPPLRSISYDQTTHTPLQNKLNDIFETMHPQQRKLPLPLPLPQSGFGW
ncbi:hypothetical protein K7432_008308 [Basidiobolus ranarum]|uniref:C2H2-type domain-containing protein n=1 Tax=Basidiobolus ranarum TaxID=34480 RepID=A0ABR2WS02_9FUNG